MTTRIKEHNDNVTAIKSDGSVITVQLIVKNNPPLARTITTSQAKFLSLIFAASKNSHRHVSAPNRTDGKRALNSLTPNTLKLTAVAQIDNGGLAQNGTPGSSCGVTQLFVATISLAISA